MFSLMEGYHNKFVSSKNLIPQTTHNKKLKKEVLSNAGDYYNDLYYIYKNKYHKQLNSLGTKNRKKLDYKKLRLAEYLPEEEKEKIQEETITDANEFNKWNIKKEADINSNLFMEHFNFQNPHAQKSIPNK